MGVGVGVFGGYSVSEVAGYRSSSSSSKVFVV